MSEIESVNRKRVNQKLFCEQLKAPLAVKSAHEIGTKKVSTKALFTLALF